MEKLDRKKITQKLMELAEKNFSLPKNFTTEMKISRELLSSDSLSTLYFFSVIEAAFNIEIPLELIEGEKTFNDLIGWLEENQQTS